MAKVPPHVRLIDGEEYQFVSCKTTNDGKILFYRYTRLSDGITRYLTTPPPEPPPKYTVRGFATDVYFKLLFIGYILLGS